MEVPHERVFRGVFTAKGDTWSDDLKNPASPFYSMAVSNYSSRIDNVYSRSVFKTAFMRTEILAFDR